MTTELVERLEQAQRRHRRLRLWAVVVAALAFVLGMLVCQSAR
jgi:hypothetical protein